MKLRKTIVSACAFAILLAPPAAIMAQSVSSVWTPRTVEEVKKHLVKNEDNQWVYTIRYGDTLSVIAEAFGVDLALLGAVNEIADLDLIFPETVLTTTYDQQQNAERISVEVPSDEEGFDLVAEIHIADQEVVLKDEVVELQLDSVQATEVAEWVTPQTVHQSIATNEIAEWLPSTSLTPTETETPDSKVNLERPDVPTSPEVPSVLEAEPMIDIMVTETTEVAEWIDTNTQTIGEVTYQEFMAEQTSELVEWVDESSQESLDEAGIGSVMEETTDYVEPMIETPIYQGPSADGLQAHVAAFKETVANMYGITSFSTFRPGDPGDHGNGLAVDFMVPVSSELGDLVAQYAISQIGSGKVSYVIWKQQIYGDWNMAWTMMEDRGSDTANHFDHVHVSFYP